MRLLSEDLKDMLDRIFEVNEVSDWWNVDQHVFHWLASDWMFFFRIPQEKRFGLEDLRSHPWLKKPLTPVYRKAMDEICAEQRVCLLRPPPAPSRENEC